MAISKDALGFAPTHVPEVAVAHAQFETIHPFVDGNGRTGRALAQAMLRHNKITTHTTVPLSAGLLVDTESYFDALTRYRQGDAGPIVRRFADAARYESVTGRIPCWCLCSMSPTVGRRTATSRLIVHHQTGRPAWTTATSSFGSRL